MIPKPIRTCLFSIFLLVGFADAEIRLHKLFTDNMVIQRDRPVKIFGWADAGQEVIVEFAGQRQETRADEKGFWKAELKAFPANDKPQSLKVSSKDGSAKLERVNILIGDVWICGGQSNMEWPMRSFNQLAPLVYGVQLPKVRLLVVKKNAPETNEHEDLIAVEPVFKDSWQECSGTFLSNFSAVGYFFGAKLGKDLNVPIGLIRSAVGGTRIEPWIPGVAWADLSKAEQGKGAASGLYNAMIRPLTLFHIKGVIWYQGESSSTWALLYEKHFYALIKGWRSVWGQGDFPFLFVQLAPYKSGDNDVTGESWAWLREAQTKALKLPNTGMVVTTDLGEFGSIHPQNKQPVGERLALLAEKKKGLKVNADSPLFEKMEVKSGRAVISFQNAGSGLETRRVAMNKQPGLPFGQDPEAFVAPSEKLRGFFIAGADQKFIPAEAKIEGQTVVVESASIPNPVALRYGWTNFPLCNLYSREGLPASPFRTDLFPAPDFQGRVIGTPLPAGSADLGSALRVTMKNGESSNTSVEMDGRKAFRTENHLKKNFRYVYFTVDDPVYKKGAGGNVMISIVYRDAGPETIVVRYDSKDPNVRVNSNAPGAWKLAGRIKIEDTQTWRQADFRLEDAGFEGRMNGCDIRLEWSEDADAVLAGASLRKANL